MAAWTGFLVGEGVSSGDGVLGVGSGIGGIRQGNQMEGGSDCAL